MKEYLTAAVYFGLSGYAEREKAIEAWQVETTRTLLKNYRRIKAGDESGPPVMLRSIDGKPVPAPIGGAVLAAMMERLDIALEAYRKHCKGHRTATARQRWKAIECAYFIDKPMTQRQIAFAFDIVPRQAGQYLSEARGDIAALAFSPEWIFTRLCGEHGCPHEEI